MEPETPEFSAEILIASRRRERPDVPAVLPFETADCHPTFWTWVEYVSVVSEMEFEVFAVTDTPVERSAAPAVRFWSAKAIHGAEAKSNISESITTVI